MTTDELEILLAIILVVSLTTERLIEILKTWFPGLDDPEKPLTNWIKLKIKNDNVRKFIIQVITFASSLGISYYMSKDKNFEIGGLNFWVVGFLATGGSAFWNQILGFTKAMKEGKKEIAKLEELKRKTEEIKIAQMKNLDGIVNS